MKRILGTVSSAFRGAVQKISAPAQTAIPSEAYQDKVRKAMDSLAPQGRKLPSQSRVIAMEIMASDAQGERSQKTPEELYLAANVMYKGVRMNRDKAKAVELWKQAADAGHPKATYSYAGCLRKGEGTPRNLAKAAEIFERLGDEGLLEAKHALGLMLSTGEAAGAGFPQDEERARELFKTAAIGGYVPAIHAAASMMEGGKGGEEEGANAVQWLEVAIEAGDPMASSTLATWYQDGRGGLEVNHEKAYELHHSAASRGMPRAQFNTGVQLFEGKGVEQDLPKAAEWFTLAAAGGVPQAMLNLGRMHEKGIGVKQDRARALQMYQEAVRAEGHLDGEDAEAGNLAVEKLLLMKEKGEFRKEETVNG